MPAPTIPRPVEEQLRETAHIMFDEVRDLTTDPNTNPTEIQQLKQSTLTELRSQGEELTLLGNGSGRIAVTHPSFDGYVVKIATYSPRQKMGFDLDGVTQNQHEAWTWEHAPESICDELMPVSRVFAENRLLMMPEVVTNPDEIPYDDAETVTDRVRSRLRLKGWSAVELDVNTVGKTDEELTVYDYGMPMKPDEDLLAESDYLADHPLPLSELTR